MNQHMLRAAAASLRQDKFMKPAHDLGGSTLFGGPVAVGWSLLKEVPDVSDEIAAATTYPGGAWRSEADNNAAITSGGSFPYAYPGCPDGNEA